MRLNPEELAEFELGHAEGLDPQQESDEAGADGVLTTNPSSSWIGMNCKTCGHTFRRGDLVRRLPDSRDVVHLDPVLRCGATDSGTDLVAAQADPPGPPDPEPGEFAASLLETWPPLYDVPVIRLSAQDWRIPRPGRRQRPLVCLYCAHTFRPGEHVVICPCSHSGAMDPGIEGCGVAVHRDPAAGLPCWERWCPTGRVTVCPVRLNRLGDL